METCVSIHGICYDINLINESTLAINIDDNYDNLYGTTLKTEDFVGHELINTPKVFYNILSDALNLNSQCTLFAIAHTWEDNVAGYVMCVYMQLPYITDTLRFFVPFVEHFDYDAYCVQRQQLNHELDVYMGREPECMTEFEDENPVQDQKYDALKTEVEHLRERVSELLLKVNMLS